MGGKVRRQVWEKSIRVESGLELQTFTMADAEKQFICVDRNRKVLREWMPWLDTTQSVSDLRFFLKDCLAGYKSGQSFRFRIMIGGDFAGTCALEKIEMAHRRAHIGYWLDKKWQGQGYMHKSVSALIDYAFEERGLELLELRAAVKNRRSRAVAEKLGMRYEGDLRKREWLYDHYVDHSVYSLLAEEWRES